jgi:mono/diheme cytochrome c family protein
MTRRRKAMILAGVAAVAAILTACGSRGIELSQKRGETASVRRGADLFAARCSGCHTLKAAGTEGSATTLKNRERVDGPNFDSRHEDYRQVLYAIRNGGFSGAIMPQNIVVGQEARDVARFLAAYAGQDAKSPPGPGDMPSG